MSSPRIHPALLLRGLLAGIGLMVATQAAQALPVYARQTGQDCGACHIGAYGPQLTAYGQKFKLGGYTDGDKRVVPLSAMLVGSYTHTKEDLPEAPDHFDTRVLTFSTFVGSGIASSGFSSNDRFSSANTSPREASNPIAAEAICSRFFISSGVRFCRLAAPPFAGTTLSSTMTAAVTRRTRPDGCTVCRTDLFTT